MNHPPVRHTRVNFSFDRTLFPGLPSCPFHSSTHITRTGRREYDQLKGTVVANFFWRSCDSFLREGVGFSLITEGVVVSTAFSAFVHESMLELGIETRKDYQGKGYAFAVCCHLIDYCIKNDFKPVWSCRLGNIASVRLAEKLGFKPSKFIPYFRLIGVPLL
jgi:RimJ/RimL family protein N-acetyltransferase